MSTARLSRETVEITKVKPRPPLKTLLEVDFLFFEVVKLLSVQDRLRLGGVCHSYMKMEEKAPLQIQADEKKIMIDRLNLYSRVLKKSIFSKGDTVFKSDPIDEGCAPGSKVIFTEPLARSRYRYISKDEAALERIKQMAIYMVNHENSYHCQNQCMVVCSIPLQKSFFVGGSLGAAAGALICWVGVSICFSGALACWAPMAGVSAAVGGVASCTNSYHSISEIDHYGNRQLGDEKEQNNKDARTNFAIKILKEFAVLAKVNKRLSFIASISTKVPAPAPEENSSESSNELSSLSRNSNRLC